MVIIETSLHEHLGHALSLIALGGHPTELGAFYVNYDETGMSVLATRLVALAGPVVSLLTGTVSFLVLRQISPRKPVLYYFVWLLGTIGFMTATGYLLFSGVLGIGDFGTQPGGVFYGASPEWLWRALLALAGGVSYYFIVRFALREIAPHLSGKGRERSNYARRLFFISYLTVALVAVAIGFLNPLGIMIVLTSAAASTLGGDSGLLWMAELLEPNEQVAATGLTFGRRWGWVALGGVVTVVYALVLGPTLYF